MSKQNVSVKEGMSAEDFINDGQLDHRYLVPKGPHGISVEEIDRVISETPIYREAREALKDAQRNQVGYGISKYPEPLTADSWTIIESLEHDISETADGLHYKIMLKDQLKKIVEELEIFKRGMGVGKTMVIDSVKNVRYATCTDIEWVERLGKFMYYGETKMGNKVRLNNEEFWFLEE